MSDFATVKEDFSYTVENSEYLPPGMYQAKLTGIRKHEGEYGPSVVVVFACTEEGPHLGKTSSRIGKPPIKEGTVLGMLVRGIYGRELNPGEKVTLQSLESFVDKPYTITVGKNKAQKDCIVGIFEAK